MPSISEFFVSEYSIAEYSLCNPILYELQGARAWDQI